MDLTINTKDQKIYQKPHSDFFNWIKELRRHKSFSSVMDFFVKTSDFPILYMEYQESKAWFSLKYSNFVSVKNSFYLRLPESESDFDPNRLYNPSQIPVFHLQMRTWFEKKKYQCFPFIFNKQVTGVFVYLSDSLETKEQIFILNSYVQNILWQEKWGQENLRDEGTNALNQKAFLQQLFIEVSRGRRLSLPLSLILLKLDQFSALKTIYGTYKTNLFIKSLLSHFMKDSRFYDIFGSWPEGYLGLILPHTSERGASLKAEKIRWSVQSADFSKVFPSNGRLTLSLGLAEYPRVNRSAESLFRSALKALAFAQKEGGGDMTAVATPPVGFKPDFLTKNLVNHLRDLT